MAPQKTFARVAPRARRVAPALRGVARMSSPDASGRIPSQPTGFSGNFMNAQSGIANRAIAFAAHRTLEQLETRMLLSGAGSLDAAFGASGLVVDPLGATSQFEKVIPLAGNKVLAAGSTGSAGHRNFVLV